MNNDERILLLEKEVSDMKEDINAIKTKQDKFIEDSNKTQLDIRDLINSNKVLNTNIEKMNVVTDKLQSQINELCEIVKQQQLQQLQDTYTEKDKKLDRRSDFWIKIGASVIGGTIMIFIGALIGLIL